MRIQRLPLCFGCFAAGILFAILGIRPAESALADERAITKVDVKSKQALLQAAKDAYEGMLKRRQTDPSVSNDVEYLYRWSRRWLEAERALGDAKDQRLSAYQAHNERMQWLDKLQQEMVNNGTASRHELASTKFFRIEAEQWLAEVKPR